MRVLLTNHRLSSRTGTELYIRDIALALLAQGHEPIAYSRLLGPIAQELRAKSVLVIDDLATLRTPPDIIHAQHHLEAMTALTHFPQVPAILVCHGWLPAEEAPPSHPRIVRYLAVDELVRLRLIEECGIAAENVATNLNFVDLDRFKPRTPLPAKPRRALVFSNYVNRENILPSLHNACAKNDIQLDVAGLSAGADLSAPESVLGNYDIVFAKGRAALEAAAVGCAVIVCDAAGHGDMVNSANFDHYRAYNFGLRLLRESVSVATISTQLAQYNPDETARVTARMRTEANLLDAVRSLIQQYREVLAEYDQHEHDALQDAHAVSNYLRHGPITADFSQFKYAQFSHELARAKEYVQHLESQLMQKQAGFENAQSVLAAQADQLKMSQNALDEARQALQQAQTAQREAERQHQTALEQVLLSHQNELAKITDSRVWRARERLVSIAWLRTLYRRLVVRNR
ncbi:hypothetical protein GCM10008090_24290 [Arenicella chitinivorans]|uniref:Glycosyltransferase subfamily 4-like N-terminal domain-containing protein n=1 Tax=Arenicella chitinivorans TaxID=1329800 RepID=A0A918RYF0_9GAMM|nr:hypothetical protein [Arenicella chitinivorans]GHA13696.1 hypothetical protein GCM10008090_24290 [Arenicella chitinivorans]